ncbi:MAG: hypothetical protein WD648_10880 [Planctomycetaceae bacterium]
MSVGIHKQLAAFVVAIAAAMAGGCCCCGPEVPVDCEDFCACLQYHGPDCCQYPFSCPRCPYFDYNYCVWHAPYFRPASEVVVSSPASRVPDAPGAIDPGVDVNQSARR